MDNTIDNDLLTQMREAGLIDDAIMSTMTTALVESTATAETRPELELTEQDIVEPILAQEIDQSLLAQELDDADKRENLYAEQSSSIDIVDQAMLPTISAIEASTYIDSKPAKAKRVPREKKASTGTGKRVSRATSAGSVADYVARIAGAQIELMPGVSVDTVPLVDSLPVKIREKTANFADFLFGGKRLSVFSQIAVKTLKDEGRISGKRLVELYQSASPKAYSIGTARSQSQQLVSLMRTLHITNTDGTVNDDSVLWSKMSA